MISNYSGLVGWILSYVYFDMHIFKESVFDKNVGWTHGPALGLIVNVPRVQNSFNLQNFEFVMLDSAWCVFVVFHVWLQTMSHRHPERTSVRNGNYLTYFATTACLLARLTMTTNSVAFINSIADFVIRIAMYYTRTECDTFCQQLKRALHVDILGAHLPVFFCNLYISYACVSLNLICICQVSRLPLNSTNTPACSSKTESNRVRAPDPELALAKLQKTTEHSQTEIDRASKAGVKTSDDESPSENISEIQAELRQLLRHKNV